ncbi:nucleotidyltransferase [Rhizobiales bacterium RZME27]|jgi:predicted nucleotidyltransferase|uniref:Nucleotidyltransferase n=1 Tax=Endobacterium cereale TaxID=2663029 RepID=A0A6A8AGA3_9HYPH|nr:nucleotidyltransferase family protein [Endobacterium cereale]MEB2842889.1 nucleotidyltransferase family protein [Endobacterium cereale]MQY49854.1 nucleotidyltransferase [Endobacterium cereale]
MSPSDVLDKNRQAIREATKCFNAANPRVFGSVARGEDRPASNIGVLVDALAGSTLLTLGGLRYELGLLTPGELHEMIRSRVLSEARPL